MIIDLEGNTRGGEERRGMDSHSDWGRKEMAGCVSE